MARKFLGGFQHLDRHIQRGGNILYRPSHIRKGSLVSGYISVMPMVIRRTDLPLFESLKDLCE
jgi:hypothetical protein